MTIHRMGRVFFIVSSLRKRLYSYLLVLSADHRITDDYFTNNLNNWLLPSGQNHSATAITLFFVGVCLPLFQTELLNVAALLLICLLLIALSFIWKRWWLVTLVCAGLCWSSYAFTNQLTEVLPPAYERVSIQVQGQIKSLPQSNQGDTRFVFEIQEIVGSHQQTYDLLVLKNKRVQLSCYRCPHQLKPNQYWHFTVRLKRPHGYASWGAFDYEKYLFRHRLIATGYVRTKETNNLLAVPEHRFNLHNTIVFPFNEWRWRIKNNITQFFQESSVGSQIILALAIGDKSGLSSTQRGVLQMSGTSHLMAISGLHVGLVFMALMWLLTWALKPFAKVFEWMPCQHMVLLPSLAGAFFYAGLAGFAVSTQRAFIMLTVYTLCRFRGMAPSLLKVLLITVFLVLVVDPNSILDVGFWLSCGAVLIIALHNQSEEDTAGKNQTLALLKLQPVLWLGMLPLVMVFFGQISLVSPIVNLVAVPLFCLFLIPLSLCTVLLNELEIHWLAEPLLNLLQQLFDWVFFVLQWLSELNFASSATMPLSFCTVLACFVIILAYLCNWWWRRWSWILIAIAVFAPIDKSGHDKLIVTLLDVGQGLAMVIEQADYTLVYDTGPAYQSGFSTAQAVLIPYLNYRGIERVNTLIISHADSDHIGGYEKLMSTFPAENVVTSRTDKLPNANACNAGQKWSRGEVSYQIISPDIGTPDGSNNRSCVLRINYGTNVLLITGDIEKQVERYLLKNEANLTANILLVPHQGSKTSSTAQFIDAVAPDLALIAAGYLNHYGHPHPNVTNRYRQRGIAMLSTIDAGSIQIEISTSDWQIKAYRNTQKRFWRHRKIPHSAG